jgi:hypothetical protein
MLSVQPFIGPIIFKLLQLGLTENDSFKIGEIYLNLLNRTFSVEDLTKGMIKTIDMMTVMTTSYTKTPKSNDKLTEVLSKVRQDLLQLDFSN